MSTYAVWFYCTWESLRIQVLSTGASIIPSGIINCCRLSRLGSMRWDCSMRVSSTTEALGSRDCRSKSKEKSIRRSGSWNRLEKESFRGREVVPDKERDEFNSDSKKSEQPKDRKAHNNRFHLRLHPNPKPIQHSPSPLSKKSGCFNKRKNPKNVERPYWTATNPKRSSSSKANNSNTTKTIRYKNTRWVDITFPSFALWSSLFR